MYVAEKYRRQGIAYALGNTFLEWCRTNGAQKVLVTAYYSNEKAIGLYETLGFKRHQITLVL